MKVKRSKSYKPPFTRVRSKNTSTDMLPQFGWQWNENGVNQTAYLYPAAGRICNKVTTDVVVPGYEQFISEGRVIANPYSRIERVITRDTWGDTKVKWTGNNGQYSTLTLTADFRLDFPVFSNSSLLPVTSYSSAMRYAQTQALSGIQEATLQGLVTVGEFRQTMNFLLSPVRGLATYFKKAEAQYARDKARYTKAVLRTIAMRNQAKRTRLLRIAAASKGKQKAIMDRISSFGYGLTDAVLGYNLGWVPLMTDLDAILHKIPALEFEERRTSRAKRVVNGSNTYTGTWAAAVNSTKRYDLTVDDVSTIRTAVLYADGFEASQHFGIRLSDVPEAAWEVIPFSFLVDYVVNVADYLGAVRALCTARILSYSTSVETEAVGTRTYVNFTPGRHPGRDNNLGSVLSFGGGSETLTIRSKYRSVDSFGPELVFGRPGGERPPQHVQNTLSLLTRQLLKIK